MEITPLAVSATNKIPFIITVRGGRPQSHYQGIRTVPQPKYTGPSPLHFNTIWPKHLKYLRGFSFVLLEIGKQHKKKSQTTVETTCDRPQPPLSTASSATIVQH